METRALLPADTPMAVLVKLGFSGHLFIRSGTRIAFFICPLFCDVPLLPVFLSPLGMNLFDYSLNSDETKRDFKDLFLRSCLFFVYLDVEEGWAGLWT